MLPPPTDHALLFDPHLGHSPEAFVATWNYLASTLATVRLAIIHYNLLSNERSPSDIILLTSARPLEPAI